MKLRIAVLFVGLTLVFTSQASSQELNCEVTVNVDNVASAQRDFLRNFEADIRKYINNNRFTDEDLSGEKIDCSLSVFFLPATGENRYAAQVVVVSQRPVYNNNEKSGKNTQVVRILDERWEFGYVPNQPMSKDEYRFEPLASFLDFYANLIIGLDLETYIEGSGSRCFQRALNICNQAVASAYANGWQAPAGSYSRFGYIDELMNLKYKTYREAFHSYHFEGLDLIATQAQRGLESMIKAIESIADMRQKQNPRSVLAKTFFDSKYLEIAELFLPWPDRDIYDRISVADPAHQGTYDTYRSR